MKPLRRSRQRGFTLIETLLATALLLLILAMLAAVTAQWLPNWNRGFARAQRSEQIAFALERMVADFAAVEFILPNGDAKRALFDGSTVAVTFIRSAIGPNKHGLEVVRLAEVADPQGPVLVRATAPFTPQTGDAASLAELRFGDANVLIRPPYRVQFSFAGAERQWLAAWRDAPQPPHAVRITIRSVASGQVFELATAARIHVDIPAECVKPQGGRCQERPPGGPQPPAGPP